ncbi:toxin-antitoxin system YwqK family antitoxin [Faecalibacter bovis]|uniref:Toxin-antitoxin system YwqK family antitoxin n=1 Tax=Faecalibacter bovis TaxID=2898187 RepID=A0ABX7XB97_9FLAO|nr:hypothetical protein [Faecalibacter bovis]QTV05158.1 hypothetical protein J9309_10235 [Faecalibacter bovis]
MRNYITIIIFILIGNIVKAQTHYEEVLRFNNGRIKSIVTYNAQNIKDGETINYHLDGAVQSIVPYINGAINGIIETYHPNTRLESKGMMVNDLQEGVFEYFYKNGNPKARILYINGKPNKIANCYDRKGNILYCGPFNMGNGEIYIYTEEGKLFQKDYFKNGELIKSETVN